MVKRVVEKEEPQEMSERWLASLEGGTAARKWLERRGPSSLPPTFLDLSRPF